MREVTGGMIIIEPMEIHGKSLVFVHFDPDQSMSEEVVDVAEQIDRAVDSVTTVIIVPNGQPNPQNPAGAYVVNSDDPEVMKAITKLAKNTMPGAVVLLEKKEFEAFTDPSKVVKV